MKLALLFFAIFTYEQGRAEQCGQVEGNTDSPFPWNVGIYIERNNQIELSCLGTIIESNAVLTAAHCFHDNISDSLRTEGFYIGTDPQRMKLAIKDIPATIQKIPKSHIHIHKYYKGYVKHLTNDLAIVKADIKFSKKVQPICVDWSGTVIDVGLSAKQAIWNKNKTINIEQTYIDSDCADDVPQDFVSFVTNDKYCTKAKDSIPVGHESEGSGLVFLDPLSHRWYLKGISSKFSGGKTNFSTYSLAKQFLNWVSNIYTSL